MISSPNADCGFMEFQTLTFERLPGINSERLARRLKLASTPILGHIRSKPDGLECGYIRRCLGFQFPFNSNA